MTAAASPSSDSWWDLEALPVPTVLLCPRFRVVGANAWCARWLGVGAVRPGGRLDALAAGPTERARLRSFLEDVQRGDARVHLGVFQRDGDGLLVHIRGAPCGGLEGHEATICLTFSAVCFEDVVRIAVDVAPPWGGSAASPVGRLLTGVGQMSAREREVLSAAAMGASLGEVAARLQVSQNTVKNHTRAVYRSLGVQSRAELYELVHATVVASSPAD